MKDYFKKAQDWAEDRQAQLITSRQRYQWAFFSILILCGLLVLCLIILLPLKSTQLVIVHNNNQGYSWVSTTKLNAAVKPNWAMTKTEIAHYIVTRESYDPAFYQFQYKHVRLFSSPSVFAQYELLQSNANKAAAINLLGAKGYRTVTIHAILPLSQATKKNPNKKNLAQVDFVIKDHLYGETQTTKTPYTVLISWQHLGLATKPYQQIYNWDRFQVTHYQLQPIYTG